MSVNQYLRMSWTREGLNDALKMLSVSALHHHLFCAIFLGQMKNMTRLRRGSFPKLARSSGVRGMHPSTDIYAPINRYLRNVTTMTACTTTPVRESPLSPRIFFDKDVVKKLALHADFKEMFRDLGLSTRTRGSREQMRNPEKSRATIPSFPRQGELCGMFATGEFIDGTIQGTSADHLVNLGHIFAEHLVSLKRKAFIGTCAKKSVGSLLTQIFRHPGIRLVQTTVKRDMYFMDETQLTRVQWLKDGRLGFFIDEIGPHLIELPNRKATNFDGCRSRLEFHPDLLFLLNPPVRLRRQSGTHAAAAPAEDSDPLAAPAALVPPTAPFPDFPHIP
ncbi:hypothetical protein F2Q69_00030076 [Brassica cretica]|uniref:Uncharacterized protein n=1 Tax=Brassica cretica TaxID=69181 RepID=A0A8S9RUI4_BRACR|nr:hypothetical protein F2Q69_00030076 [Brassica cretica]